MGNADNSRYVRRLVQMSMLAAIAVVLILLIRFPLLSGAPYLEYDMADIPVLLGAFTLGPAAGMMILTVVSAIQAFLLGGNNIIGFIMHMTASGALVLVSSLLYRHMREGSRSLVISLVAGSLSMAALIIPLNLIFTPLLFGMPVASVKALILPVVLPFNLIKAGLNGSIFFLLYKSLRYVIKR